MKAISIENISHIYSKHKIFQRKKTELLALKNVSLEICKGEIFGIVGPNGAGKTTLIKIICNLLIPTNGNVKILGKDIKISSRNSVISKLGLVLGGDKGLYYRLTGRENLLFFGYLYNLHGRKLKERVVEVLKVTGLFDFQQNRVETYSRGMKQRLHIARALLHNPSILVLDEPTIGLDPVGSAEIRKMIKKMANEGKTILLTTHYMHEVEELCQRMAVINNGEIIEIDTPNNLIAKANKLTVIDIKIIGGKKPNIEKINELPFVSSAYIEKEGENRIIIYSLNGTEDLGSIIQLLNKTEIGKIEMRNPSLEDAYIDMVANIE